MRSPKHLNQDPKAFAKARGDARITQYGLAARLKLSRSLICEYEGGTRSVPMDRLKVIAEIFGCPVEQLQAPGDQEGQAAAAADVDVPELRDAERSDGTHDLPELRDAEAVGKP